MELKTNVLFTDPSLIAYYRLEGNANDSKGSNTGTASNITYSVANGKFGQGAGFNGTSSVITAPDTNDLDLTGNHSICAWINTNVNNADKSIVEKYTGGNGYYFRLNSTGKLLFGNQASSGGAASTATGATTLATNTWYFVTATYDGTNLRVYLNAVQDGISGSYASGNSASTALLNIGRRGDSGSFQWWNGEMDEVSVFSKALSQSEILALYQDSSFLMMF